MMLTRYTYICTCLIAILMLVGCQNTPRPSNNATAVQSLEKMLETWKSGGKAEDLKNTSPSIIAVDDDWEKNVALSNYRIQPNPFDDGVNLHFTVDLMLKNKQGKDVKKQQVYIVGTNPVITIFRK